LILIVCSSGAPADRAGALGSNAALALDGGVGATDALDEGVWATGDPKVVAGGVGYASALTEGLAGVSATGGGLSLFERLEWQPDNTQASTSVAAINGRGQQARKNGFMRGEKWPRNQLWTPLARKGLARR
jgi:hypothetical protein